MDLRHHHTSWFILLLTTATLVIFWPLYSGETTLQGENTDLILPVLSHMREALLQGEWPLWNKYQYQGVATSILPLYWNPIYLFTAVLFPSPLNALNAIYLFAIFIGGLGFYKILKLIFTDFRLRIIGGLCYPLVGFFAVQSQYLDLIWSAAWLPILIYTTSRYQSFGRLRDFTFLIIGYYLFITGSSQGFVITGTGVLVIQTVYKAFRNQSPRKLGRQLLIYFGAGLLVWKIYWIRWFHYTPSSDVTRTTSSISGNLSDYTSLFLSKATATSENAEAIFSHVLIHSFAGVIILTLAVLALTIYRNTSSIKWGIVCLILFLGSLLCPVLEPFASGYGSRSSIAITATIKILFTIAMLILALHAVKSLATNPRQGRSIFLFLGLTIGGISVFFTTIERDIYSNLFEWYCQLDLLKNTLFLILTGILMWISRPSVRLFVLGCLVITEVGISAYLNHDEYLYNAYPASSFKTDITYPEKKTNTVDLRRPVGLYQDEDFKIASLEKNTGTLFGQIVKDGYWPWSPVEQIQKQGKVFKSQYFRYPLFYYSLDPSPTANPSYTNYDDAIAINNQSDHTWDLTILTKYEKQLVLNQNYHQNWEARIDNYVVPVVRTTEGKMSIFITPGLHKVTFSFHSEGLLHIFWVTMAMWLGLMGYLLIKKQFPYAILATIIPFVIISLTNNSDKVPVPPTQDTVGAGSEWSDFTIDFESHSPFWFIRPEQISPENSYDGYRSEKLNKNAEYSATLQLHRTALKDKKELEYRFHLLADNPVEAGIVLKTYSAEEEAYNIRYFKSLNNEQWETIEGRFSLEELPGTLIKAEFYIWNNRKQEFLIDDIQIKLNP